MLLISLNIILQYNLANSGLNLNFFERIGGITSVYFNPVSDSQQFLFIFLKVLDFYVQPTHDGFVLFPGPSPAW